MNMQNEEIENEDLDNEEVEEETTSEESEEKGSEEEKSETDEEEGEGSEEEEIHPDFQGLSEKAKAKAQKRFNKITTEKYKALERENRTREENQALKDRLDAIENKLSGGASTEVEVQEDPKPIRDEFDDEEEWIEALTDWKAEKAVTKTLKAEQTKKEKERLQSAEKNHNKTVTENFGKNVRDAMEKYDDYLDVTSSVTIPLNSPLGKEILDSDEYGANIMYALGKDPDLFERMNGLSGKQLTKAIGSLESSFENSKKETPKPKKKGPPAPPNVNRRGTSHSGKVDINKLSPEEHYRLSCEGKI